MTVTALTTEHTENTEEELRNWLFLVSVCSVVNEMDDGNGISFGARGCRNVQYTDFALAYPLS